MFSALGPHSSMDRQRRRRRQQLPEVYKLISPPLSEGIVTALKPDLVSAIALACCAPLSLPFFLLIALFRPQEFVALWLHSQVGHWSLSSSHFCSMNNNLCKMNSLRAAYPKGAESCRKGFHRGQGVSGSKRCSCEG